ncbi:MAG: GWxTD domain-containing protein [Gemmatimonadales bacterium]
MVTSFRLLPALLALTQPVAGATQTAPLRDRRQAAEAFADSVGAITDRDILRGLERDLMLRARRERTNPTVHFRLGALALAQNQPNDAAAEFKSAIRLDGQWAAAWFGLGQAELRLGELADTTQLGRRALLARDAWARATEAFARAVTLDTALAGRLERAASDRATLPSAVVYRDGLRRVVTGPPGTRSVAVAIALGRTERALGDTTEALAAFDLGIALTGGPGLAQAEAALTRLTGRRPGGVENYFATAGATDSRAVAMLRDDFGWIATAAELRLFDAADPADRAQLLWRFWANRDRAELRQNGERLAEHYRRLSVAARLYPNRDDLRHAIFVRHGEPDNRATARIADLRPNETWRYRRPEGDLVVHFYAGADSTNYRLTESLFDLAREERTGAPAGDERSAPVDVTEALVRSRAQLSPFYQAAAAGRRDQLAQFRIRERELGRAHLNLALTTDRFPIRFDRDLPARVAVLGVVDSSPYLAIAFSVPTFGLDSLAKAGRYPFRLRVSAWNLVSEDAYALDTIIGADPAGSTGVVYGAARLAVPPGSYAVRGVLDAGAGRGLFAGRDQVAVGASEPGWGMTELAVGVAGRGVVLAPGRPLEPSALFSQADTITVSADLEAGEGARRDARARLFVRPITSAGESRWRGFPGRSDWLALPPTGLLSVRAPLRQLRPGPHELELLVTGVGGEFRRRWRIEVTALEK